MITPNHRRDLELLRRIKDGQDRAAKEELVAKYLPMVKHIVKRKCSNGSEFEDLIQEGLISLLKAIDNYDGNQYPVKFSTFAYICILRRMLNMQKYFTSTKFQVAANALSLCGYPAGDESKRLIDVIDNYHALDPQELVIQKFNLVRLKEVLKAYLTKVEYTVFFLYLQGLNCSEIGALLELESKVVDNAKTRARIKLQKIIQQYGSLSNPRIPLRPRKRVDLAMEVKAI
ncbi:MAG TPA: sigma-70 family RNA polymerase sigma factor [Firmicutes bacterium]|nr:sigma-70 family RNA polymerase sigma factor [Bacillota bacterium]